MTEEQEPTLRLHVSSGDVTIEVAGPVEDAETWFEALRNDYLDNSSTTSQSTLKAAEQENQERQRTLEEYRSMIEAPTKRDLALLVGWYLDEQDSAETFTTSELKERAQAARINLGENLSRDVGKQAENGRLTNVGKRDGFDEYQITYSGEQYVKNELLGPSE